MSATANHRPGVPVEFNPFDDEELTCETCDWFEPIGSVTSVQISGDAEWTDEQPGECRIGPPSLGGWPRAYGSQYCGRYDHEEEMDPKWRPRKVLWMCSDPECKGATTQVLPNMAPKRCPNCG